MQEPIRVDVMRTQLGRVRGTGSARSGVHHWWVERITAVALVPLTLWFIFAMLSLLHQPQLVVYAWVGRPVNTVLLLALIVMTFHHMQLGIQVILEDYVAHPAFMMIAILVNKGVALLLGLAAAVAVLKMAFTPIVIVA